jgi:hypothetical protein
MYSGTTLTKYSGRVMGAHQKFDRVAHKQLRRLLPEDAHFPQIRAILQFEGRNGPDGIKRKSPAKDEPWHYYDPFNDKDVQLLDIIRGHYDQLVRELEADNTERAAFEAAWLAHALVDGMTPAHHYPYEEKLAELRGGQGIESRNSLKEKLIMHGSTPVEKLRNNWKMWGSKGLMMTHGTFELGIASLIAPLTFTDAILTDTDMEEFHKVGMVEFFRRRAREVALLDMYNAYYRKGWTPRLAYQVRHRLSPLIVRTVTMAWYGAVLEANKRKKA